MRYILEKSKRVLVTFTSEQWRIIQSMKGSLGLGDAEIIRNIILSWLSEKSFISSEAKEKLRKSD